MVNLRKTEIAFLEDSSCTMLYQFNSESLENFIIMFFAVFSNGSRQPSF